MKNMLLQIRGDEKKAAYRRIAAWKNDTKRPNAALQLQDTVVSKTG